MNIDLNRAIEVLQACGYECEEIESLRQQLADSQKQVTLLRYPLDGASQIITFEGVPYYLLDTYERDEALAATADLSGVIMCEKEPVAYMAVYKDQVMGFMPTQESGTTPVYRTWELR